MKVSGSSFSSRWPDIEGGILSQDDESRREAYSRLQKELHQGAVTDAQAEAIAQTVAVDLMRKIEQHMVPTPLWQSEQPMATFPSYPLDVLTRLRQQLSPSWQRDIALIHRENTRAPYLDREGRVVSPEKIREQASQWNRLTDAGLLFVMYRDSTHCSDLALRELSGRYAELGAFLMESPQLDLSGVSLGMYPHYKPKILAEYENERMKAA